MASVPHRYVRLALCLAIVAGAGALVERFNHTPVLAVIVFAVTTLLVALILSAGASFVSLVGAVVFTCAGIVATISVTSTNATLTRHSLIASIAILACALVAVVAWQLTVN